MKKSCTDLCNYPKWKVNHSDFSLKFSQNWTS